MSTISSIDHLYAFEDGDTISAAMGVKWVNGEVGYGLQQYFNPTTKQVMETDFTKHPVLLYPQPYSSKRGSVVVPEATGQQWYYGNISDEGGILQDGKVKDKFKTLFEVTTLEVNKMTFPALKIKGNLATADDHTDKYIYYKSSYQGKAFTCQQLIPIMTAVGESYKVNISYIGADGSGDNVLADDNDWCKIVATLSRSGAPIDGDVAYKWQRLVNGVWKDVANVKSVTEVSGNTLKVFDAGVEGVEMFRCVVTYASVDYYGIAEVSDIHDPYYIDMGRSQASGAVSVGSTVTYSPKVYSRADGKISTGWSFSFSFTDFKGNALNDITERMLTYDNILKYDGISVRLEAQKA